MKLFLFERADEVGWDEYDGLLVRAKTEEEARKLIENELSIHKWTVTEVTVKGPTAVILSSYNAG